MMRRLIPAMIWVVNVSLPGCRSARLATGCTVCDDITFTIRRLTDAGERPVWSPDGRKIAYMDHEFGNAWEIDRATGLVACLTCDAAHPGMLRIHYLSDGSVILTGARPGVPPFEARVQRTELWYLKPGTPPVLQPLDVRLHEGVAVSRQSNRIAWALTFLQDPSIHGSQLWAGTVKITPAGAEVVDRRVVLEQNLALLEAQDFFPGDRALFFSSYFSPVIPNAEAMGIVLSSGEITNYSRHPAYDEAEGLFPDGRCAAIESGRHIPGASGIDSSGQNLDLYLLRLDGSGTNIKRLTYFGEEPTAKANNPSVSPDGTRIVFARSLNVGYPELLTGRGEGIFLLECDCR